MNFTAYYSIFIGIMMIIQWIFFITTGNVPELTTAFWEIIFHILVEFLTVFMLLITGWKILKKSKKAIQGNLLAQGMLIYSAINSSGYFAQLGQWVFIKPIYFSPIIIIFFFKKLHQCDKSK